MGHSRKCLFQQTWQLLKDNIKTLASKTNTKYCTCFIFPEVEPWHHVSMDIHPSISVQPMPTKHSRTHSTAYSETWVHGMGRLNNVHSSKASVLQFDQDRQTHWRLYRMWLGTVKTQNSHSSPSELRPQPLPQQHPITSKAEKPLP